jgi:hypothetical protein
MIPNSKRIYMLGTFQVEHKNGKWRFRDAYRGGTWSKGYGSEISVSLMIARALMREIKKRDAPYALES